MTRTRRVGPGGGPRTTARLASLLLLASGAGLVACAPSDSGGASDTPATDATSQVSPSSQPESGETAAVTEATPSPVERGDAVDLPDGPSSTAIDWEPCERDERGEEVDRLECSRIRVPLDAAAPDGAQVEVALLRRRAAGESTGTILVNPGGPGGSGVGYAANAENMFDAAVLERYDVVGFDPRGTNSSTPVVCLTDGETDPTRTSYDVTDDAEVQRMRADLTTLAGMCRAHSGSLLDHVGSDDVVRDMDAIRALLGEDTLTFVGYSYGTLLGALYAEAYPEHVGRMVLDGAIDPALDYAQTQDGLVDAFDTGFARFVDSCRSLQAACPLESDPEAAAQQVVELAASLDADPAATSGGDLTGADLVAAIRSAVQASWTWEEVSEALVALVRDGDAEGFADGVGAGTEQTGGNWRFWYRAVDCSDYPRVDTFEQAVANARAIHERSPLYGSEEVAEAVCVMWPSDERPLRLPVDAAGAPPILVLGGVGDPVVPYRWAVSLADQLDSGMLLTFDGDGHGAYRRGSGCIDEAVEEYLLDGALPADGEVCDLGG